jgi:hypothetical protein
LHAGNTQRETYNATDAFGLLLGMQSGVHIDRGASSPAGAAGGADVQPPAPGDICHQSIGPPHLQPEPGDPPLFRCVRVGVPDRRQAGGQQSREAPPTYLPTD